MTWNKRADLTDDDYLSEEDDFWNESEENQTIYIEEENIKTLTFAESQIDHYVNIADIKGSMTFLRL